MELFLRDLAWCVGYLAALGVASFIIGQLLPKSWLRDPHARWFRTHGWEKNGAVYRRCGVQKWKDRVIDMSRIFQWMVPKSIRRRKSVAELDDMIRETMLAEAVHELLMVLGFVCWLVRRSRWSLLFSALWALGNLPYVIIQRFNRPRLVHLRDRMAAHSPAPAV